MTTPDDGATRVLRSTRVLLDGRLAAADVTVSAGQVTDISPALRDEGAVDLGDMLLAPVPLDLHVHGAGGTAVPPDGTLAGVDAAIADACGAVGWTSVDVAPPYDYLATLPAPGTAPDDLVEAVARAASEVRASSRCVGLRIEGAFLNPARAGVWPPAMLMHPDAALLGELVAAADGQLRIVDVAPELPGALPFIAAARAQGLVVSLAHSDATYAQARAAIDAGATLATHLWNAMRPLHHREPGIVGAALADPRVCSELVCDGHHVHPAVLRLTVAAAGAGGVAAVSDASPLAGCTSGELSWGGVRVRLVRGRAIAQEGRLAGSAHLLCTAPAVLHDAGMTTLDATIALAAAPRRVLDPARELGLMVGDQVWLAGAVHSGHG